jgi:hypothetical protein
MKSSSYVFLIAPTSFLLACAIASGACSAKVATTPSVSVSPPSEPPAGIVYAPGAAPHDACQGDVYYPDDGGYVACLDGVWVWEPASWSIPSGYTVDAQLENDVSGPPQGLVLPPGIAIGGACEGDVYFPDDGGDIVCEDGVWAYASQIPAGYVIDVQYGDSSSGETESGESGSTSGGSDGVTFPPGIEPGVACEGDIYFEDDGGYVACVDGAWEYENAGWAIPAGYVVDPTYRNGFDGSGDSS